MSNESDKSSGEHAAKDSVVPSTAIPNHIAENADDQCFKCGHNNTDGTGHCLAKTLDGKGRCGCFCDFSVSGDPTTTCACGHVYCRVCAVTCCDCARSTSLPVMEQPSSSDVFNNPERGTVARDDPKSSDSIQLKENGSFIPEVYRQVLLPAVCGIPGHFWFQENGGNCLMCQREQRAASNIKAALIKRVREKAEEYRDTCIDRAKALLLLATELEAVKVDQNQEVK